MTMDREKALQALDEADKINNAPGAFRDECIEAYQLIEPHFPTFRAALTAPDAVDVRGEICAAISEMLDNPDEHGIYPTTKCFDRIEQFFLQGLLRTADDELKRVTQALEQCLSFLIKHNMVNRDDERVLKLVPPAHASGAVDVEKSIAEFFALNTEAHTYFRNGAEMMVVWLRNKGLLRTAGDGFVLVPIEPTPIMMERGFGKMCNPALGHDEARNVYKAMIAAVKK